jgi:predicted phage-related endonuclease
LIKIRDFMSEGSTALQKGLNANLERRHFIGGSDARTIMGDDESALVHLWREKRGEVEPEDLSGNLIVQLGVVTEPLNRHWFERNPERHAPCAGSYQRTQTPICGF